MTDPTLRAIKQISFENEGFFINCPPANRKIVDILMEDEPEANFGFKGLLTADGDTTAILKGLVEKS